MLLWLPLFSGNALAASLAMQLQQGQSHEAEMAQMMMSGDQPCDMADMGGTTDQHNSSCGSCGLCHLAYSAYLAVPAVTVVAVQTAAHESTPYLVAFVSFTSAPLVPPPLARA